jgi:hypothetical protein
MLSLAFLNLAPLLNVLRRLRLREIRKLFLVDILLLSLKLLMVEIFQLVMSGLRSRNVRAEIVNL